MGESRWEERYLTGDLPWDRGAVDPHLQQITRDYGLSPCRALEIGCGTGTNAIWLAREGLQVTAVDIAPTAVEMARKKAADAGVECTLVTTDFLETDLADAPFGFAFDRGCFHSLGTHHERSAFARAVARHLDADGLWLSRIGSTDGPSREGGPPRLSAIDITVAVEPHFEILRLEAAFFHDDTDAPIPAWTCLMRRRGGV